MNLPSELSYKILFDLPVDELVNICSASSVEQSLCNEWFWINRFKRDGLPLLTLRNNVSSWVLEYKNTQIAQLRKEHYVQNLLNGKIIVLDLIKVYDVTILPSFFDKQRIEFIHQRSILERNASKSPRAMILKWNGQRATLFVDKVYSISLNLKEVESLLLIFTYYELDPVIAEEGKTYRVPQSVLRELGIIN